MLGRGLESLIPPKDSKQEPVIKNQEIKDEPDEGDKIESDENPENLSVASIAGERPKISERVENLPGTRDEGRQGGKFSSGASLNFDARRPTGGKDFQDSLKKHPESIFLIEIEKIKSNPHQPRRNFDEESIKELAASIQEFGILQPLLVSKIEEETETGTRVSYQLIAGERRFLAAKMLGLERIPAIIKKIDFEADRLEMAIIENLQRADLNPLEAGRAFAKLQDEFGLTQREIAQRIGKSREVVANTMRLLNLPSNIQEALAQNKINESQARVLLAVNDLNQQQILFQELLSDNLSVRDLKEKIKDKEVSAQNEDPEKVYLENQLEEVLGTKVKIDKNHNKGKIIIKFFSPEELDAIIKKICNS